jgi:long-chain acyl-CoA synthetase
MFLSSGTGAPGAVQGSMTGHETMTVPHAVPASMNTEAPAAAIEANTVFALLADQARRTPNEIVVRCQGRSTTYSELTDSALALATALAARGIRAGDHVSICLPRSERYLLAYFAIAALGAVIVPIGPDLTAREIASDIGYCDVRLAITDAPGRSKHPNDVPVLILEPMVDVHPPRDGSRAALPAPMADPNSPAILLHTSGSLGRPKRVVLSHGNVLSNARAHARSTGFVRSDRVLITLPMHFGYCNTAQILCHIALGGRLVLLPHLFTPASFCAAVEREGVTTVTLVPTLIHALAAYEGMAAHDLSSLRTICFGGGPIAPDVLARAARALPHVEFVQTYGQTEASPRITTMRQAQSAPRCVGQAIAGVSLTIRDETGAVLPPRAIGEICVSGPGVMLGYYRREAETADVLRNGVLHTGDLGYLDETGRLFLVGRRRNLIIRAGINIYPEEVEEHLKSHPDVSDAVVLGEDDESAGEIPIAIVVPSTGRAPSEPELLRHCRTGLAPYKIPARFILRAQVPRTYNGKVAREQLLQELASDVAGGTQQ